MLRQVDAGGGKWQTNAKGFIAACEDACGSCPVETGQALGKALDKRASLLRQRSGVDLRSAANGSGGPRLSLRPHLTHHPTVPTVPNGINDFNGFHGTLRKARNQRFQRNHDFTIPPEKHDFNEINEITISRPPPENHETNGFNEITISRSPNGITKATKPTKKTKRPEKRRFVVFVVYGSIVISLGTLGRCAPEGRAYTIGAQGGWRPEKAMRNTSDAR